MADKKKLSIEEILAAARKLDGGSSENAQDEQVEEVASPEPSAPEPKAESPAAPAKPAAGGGRPSTADILAMARAKKSGDGAASDGAKAAPAKEKPAAAAPKATVKEEPKGGPRDKPLDTSSILAAARGGAEPKKVGPVTKAEAPAKPAKPKLPPPPMPSKPEYAKPRPAAAAADDRRGFFGTAADWAFGSMLGIGMTSLAATGGLWSLGGARFMFPNILREPPSKFKVGFPGDYAPGQVETKYVAQYGVWVVNYEFNGQPEIYALKTVCTHLGCTPNWLEGEQKFKCPCHGSGFYKDGINFEGPAPRPLERYAIQLAADGQLEVDKSKKFQEEMGQWADPASFFAV